MKIKDKQKEWKEAADEDKQTQKKERDSYYRNRLITLHFPVLTGTLVSTQRSHLRPAGGRKED